MAEVVVIDEKRSAGLWLEQAGARDSGCYLALAVLAATFWFTGESPTMRWISMGLLAAYLVAYLVMGRVASRNPGGARTYIYCSVVVALSASFFLISPYAGFILFLTYPQVWIATPTLRSAFGWNAILTGACALAQWEGYDRAHSWTWTLGTFALGQTFSLIIGIWITSVMARAEEEERLHTLLREAQDELAEAHRREGAQAERTRVARDVHDTLAQGFTSIVLLAQAGIAERESAPEDGTDDAAGVRLRQIAQTARENLAEARALVDMFSPPSLRDASLTEALRTLTESFGAISGTQCTFETTGTVTGLDDARAAAVLRCAQESLANCRKHASARTVGIGLDAVDGWLTLTVSDDGAGFDTTRPSTGFGIAGMRDRLAEVKGTLTVDSHPGHGTIIEARLWIGETDT